MKYFYKEIVANRVLVNGAPVPFEVLDGNRGVIALADDSPVATELDKLAGRFGVVKVSEQEYQEKKTLHPFRDSVKRSPLSEKLRVVQTRQPTNPFARQVGAAAVAEMAPPKVVPQRPDASLPATPAVPPALQPDPMAGQPAINLSPGIAPAAPGEQPAGEPAPKFTPSTRRISRKVDAVP